jgi:urease accessory protein
LAAGFAHPFHGWDHLVVMVAVGLWAAQSKRWWLPFAFVGILAAGAGVALFGFAVPGVEPLILVSTIVFAGLVLFKVRAPASMSLGVVSLFAFFHGVAHGTDIPSDSERPVFVAGFLAASWILNGVGYAFVCRARCSVGAQLKLVILNRPWHRARIRRRNSLHS